MRKRYLAFSIFVIVILVLMTFAEAYQIADNDKNEEKLLSDVRDDGKGSADDVGSDVNNDEEGLLANVDNVNEGSDEKLLSDAGNVNGDDKKLLANVDDVEVGDNNEEGLLANVYDVKSGDVKVKDNVEVGDSNNDERGLFDNIVNDFKSWIGFFNSIFVFGKNKVSGYSITGNVIGGITGNAVENGYPVDPYVVSPYRTGNPSEYRPFPYGLALSFYLSYTREKPMFFKWDPNAQDDTYTDEYGNKVESDYPHIPATITAFDDGQVSLANYERFISKHKSTAVGLPSNYLGLGLDKGISYFDGSLPRETKIFLREDEKKLTLSYIYYVLKRVERLQRIAQITLFMYNAYLRNDPLADGLFQSLVPNEIRDPLATLPLTAYRQMILERMANGQSVSEGALLNYDIPFKSMNDFPTLNEYVEQVEKTIRVKAMYNAIIKNLQSLKARYDYTKEHFDFQIINLPSQSDSVPEEVLEQDTMKFLSIDYPFAQHAASPFKQIVGGYKIKNTAELQQLTGIDPGLYPYIDFTIERYYVSNGIQREEWKEWDFDLRGKQTYKGASDYLGSEIEKYGNFVNWLDTAFPMLAIKDSDGNYRFNGISTYDKTIDYLNELRDNAVNDLKNSQIFINRVFKRNADAYKEVKDLRKEWLKLIERAPALDPYIVPEYDAFNKKVVAYASIFSPSLGAGIIAKNAEYIRDSRLANGYFSQIQMMHEYIIGENKYNEISNGIVKRVGVVIAMIIGTAGAGALLKVLGLMKDMRALYNVYYGIKNIAGNIKNAEPIGQWVTNLAVLGFNLYSAGIILSDGFNPVYACAGLADSHQDYGRVMDCVHVASMLSMAVIVLPETETMATAQLALFRKAKRTYPEFNPNDRDLRLAIEMLVKKLRLKRDAKVPNRYKVTQNWDGSPVEPDEFGYVRENELVIDERYDKFFSDAVDALWGARGRTPTNIETAIVPAKKGVAEMGGFPNKDDLKPTAVRAVEQAAAGGAPLAKVIVGQGEKILDVPEVESSTQGLIESSIKGVDNFFGAASASQSVKSSKEIIKELESFLQRESTIIRGLSERVEETGLVVELREGLANSGHFKPISREADGGLYSLVGSNSKEVIGGDLYVNRDGSVKSFYRATSVIIDYAKEIMQRADNMERYSARTVRLKVGEKTVILGLGKKDLVPWMAMKMLGRERAYLMFAEELMPRELILHQGIREAVEQGIKDGSLNSQFRDVSEKIKAIMSQEVVSARQANLDGRVGSAPITQASEQAEKVILVPFIEEQIKNGNFKVNDVIHQGSITREKRITGRLLLFDSGDTDEIVLNTWFKFWADNHRYRYSDPLTVNIDGVPTKAYISLQVLFYRFKSDKPGLKTGYTRDDQFTGSTAGKTRAERIKMGLFTGIEVRNAIEDLGAGSISGAEQAGSKISSSGEGIILQTAGFTQPTLREIEGTSVPVSDGIIDANVKKAEIDYGTSGRTYALNKNPAPASLSRRTWSGAKNIPGIGLPVNPMTRKPLLPGDEREIAGAWSSPLHRLIDRMNMDILEDSFMRIRYKMLPGGDVKVYKNAFDAGIEGGIGAFEE